LACIDKGNNKDKTNNDDVMQSPVGSWQALAVASGKGGVGKSTVTVNLAAALQEKGFVVGIIDCDIYGFSVARLLGVEGQRPEAKDGKIQPIVVDGIEIISMGNFVEDNSPVIWRGPMLGKVLRQFLEDVAWNKDLNYLLLDLPPGTGDMALDVARFIPGAGLILVTTPQEVAADVAGRAANAALKTGLNLLGVVENMSYFVCPHCEKITELFGAGGGQKLAGELKVPLLARIPLTATVREMGDKGRPAARLEGSLEAAVFGELADRVVTALK